MFNSIRTKLTLWYVGMLALFIVAFAAVTYSRLVRQLDNDVNGRLVEMARVFGSAVNAENEERTDDSGTADLIGEVAREMQFHDYQFAAYTTDGNEIVATNGISVPPSAVAGESGFQDVNVAGVNTREYRSVLPIGTESVYLLVFHSLSENEAMKRQLGQIFLLGVPLTLLLAGLGGYFLARASLSPVVEMSRQATRITAQNLSERISISNEQDELGHLAGVLNSLLARLDDSFEQQRRFMADASHELRTPIAIIRGESEVALSRTDRSGGDYRESLKIVQEESKRLTHLVEDLFTLARIDAGEFRANFTLVYLDEIVAEAVKAVRSLAREKRVSIEFEADAEMPMTGDDAMLRRLFVNLLDNAIKYNTENGSVMVSCRSESGKYNVSVSDTGSGIPPAERGRVFERFYRVDKARGHADEAGGAGLGLSIARWIAEIHGADIRLSSSVDNGSVFTVNFPAYK